MAWTPEACVCAMLVLRSEVNVYPSGVWLLGNFIACLQSWIVFVCSCYVVNLKRKAFNYSDTMCTQPSSGNEGDRLYRHILLIFWPRHCNALLLQPSLQTSDWLIGKQINKLKPQDFSNPH
jgi:hypothetical protein